MSDGTTGSFQLNPTVLAEAEPEGRAWATVILEEGWSPNGKWYSREAIMDPELPALVEGVFAMDEHNLGLPDSVLTRVGVNQQPRAEIGPDGKARLLGVFRPISEQLRESMLNAWKAGATNFAGLSIRGDGVVRNRFVESIGQVVPVVEKITSIKSVDVVKHPARGGKFVSILESVGAEEGAEAIMTPEELQELLAQAAQAGAEQAIAMLAEAGGYEDEEDEEDDEDYEALDADYEEDEEDYEDYEDDGDDDLSESIESQYLDELEQTGYELASLRDTVRRQAGMAAIEQALTESRLQGVVADRARERLVESLNYGVLFRGADIDGAVVSHIIESERAYAAQLNPINPAGTPASAITGISHARDRVVPRIAATFRGVADDKGNQPFTSLSEAYCQWHGEVPWGLSSTKVYKSLFSNYDSEERAGLAESIDTSTFGDVWANVLYKEMLDDYRQQPFNEWQNFVSKWKNLKDFRDHKVVRVGGYGNFPKVLEGATYQYVTSPTDEGTSLRAWKYGGLERVTWESIVNDDLDALKDIPSKMAYGLARTEYEFFMDLLFIDNAVMGYDSIALYDTNTHKNYATSQAITITALKTAQTQMRLQKVYGASSDVEVMGPRGKIKYIVCRLDDVERINTLVNPSDAVRYDGASNSDTNIDPWSFKGRGIVVLPYEKLDVLSLARMFFVADPKMAGVNVLAAGHLNGRREPEMWAQTDPSTGEPFAADTLVYKARHVYGGVPVDHRPVRRHDLSA